MGNEEMRPAEARKPQEQRKHTRVRHASSVIVNAEGATFAGSTVNISRSGMQLVVNMPASYKEIRSITLALPSSSEPMDIPCRIVRAEKDGAAEHQTLLGVEISFQTEAQMLLIEKFIRHQLSESLKNGAGENRLLPRSQCAITGVSTNRTGLRVLSIDNISSEGLLLRFQGNLKTGDRLSLEFLLPGDNRTLQIEGQVLYVIENMTADSSAAGITFRADSAIVQARIKNFIVSLASGRAMRDICEGFSSRDVAHEFRIIDQRQIIDAFRRLQVEKVDLNSLFEGNLLIQELRVARIDPEKGTWTASRAEGDLHRDSPTPSTGYFSFCLDGGSYYFKSDFFDWSDGTPVLKMPETLFRSEKRSYQRESLSAPETVSISIQTELDEKRTIQGKVLDVSRHGLLCEIPHSAEIMKRVYSGKPLQFSLLDRLGLSSRGEIRHFSKAIDEDGDLRLRIGVQAGVVRDGYLFRKISRSRWNRMQSTRRVKPISDGEPLTSEILSYHNKKGQEIKALLNRTGDPSRPSTVVIIPPAFGKKKEAMAALAATLVTNFRHRHRNLVVLRYDGINRPGESFSEEKELKRGYEMLRYRIPQSLEDLKTTIDFAYDNPHFKPEQVALISCSMSALDCRRLLAMGDRRVHYWVSLLGVPAAQTVLINTLGGLDIIGNARMGIPNGINGLLGYLLDMDIMARDLIEHRYAYLSDARQDLTRISLPVLWVFGTHDRWLSPDEIRDIMSVQSAAKREILEVPTGHNLRTSEDALHTFRLITSWLYLRVHHKNIIAYEPEREQLLKLIGWERERLLQPQSIQTREIWKSYLIGDNKRSPGYDFYRNLQDFRSFFATQAELLRPEEGGRIADMGCGTGLMVEQLLERVATRSPENNLAVTAVDLVPEALERTIQKWQQVCQRHPGLEGHSLECRQMDLSPNKLVPVHNFIKGDDLPLAYLRNRVEGLTTEILDGLEASNFPRLRSLLEGEPINDDIAAKLKRTLRPEESSVVFDFNRIARFLKQQLLAGDLISNEGDSNSPIDGRLYRTLHASELRMERLNFGSCGQNLQLPFPDAYFDKLIASLFLSYLQNPDDLVCEFFRILKPDGLILASSMRPDGDISTIYTNYIGKVQNRDPKKDGNRDRDLNAARNMLNEAAGLLRLEEDGYFRFYTAEELQRLLESTGFQVVDVASSLGNPSQAVIVLARKPH